MSTKTNRNKYTLEGLVIVGSILLALAIESWWEERGNRILERELLTALEIELIEARAQYVDYRDYLAEVMIIAYGSIKLMDGNDLDLPDQERANRIALSVGPIDKYFPPKAALNDILNNGGITFIESQEIRQAISNYQQGLALDSSTQDMLEDIWLTQLTPYRYKFGTLGLNLEELGIQVTRSDASLRAHLNNTEYRNIITAHIRRTENVRIIHTEVIQVIDSLLGLLGD